MLVLKSYTKFAFSRSNHVLKSIRLVSIEIDESMRLNKGQHKLGGLEDREFIHLTEGISPFMSYFMKPKLISCDRGHLEMMLPFRKEFIGNPLIPCLHGGVTAALIDHVGGFCAWSMLDNPKQLVNTVDLRIDYLVPAPCEDIYCTAVIAHRGSKLIRTDITCWNKSKSTKVAIGRGMYNVYSLDHNISSMMKQHISGATSPDL